MLLLTFMIAAGALTGEAFYGVEAAVLAVLDEISLGGQALSLYSWWPLARLFCLVLFHLFPGAMVYVLLSKARIIGGGAPGGAPPTPPNVRGPLLTSPTAPITPPLSHSAIP